MNSKVFQSSHLMKGDYDSSTSTMTITFTSGSSYSARVPESVWNELCQAVSPGTHFHRYIKPHYTMTRLKEGDQEDSNADR